MENRRRCNTLEKQFCKLEEMNEELDLSEVSKKT